MGFKDDVTFLLKGSFLKPSCLETPFTGYITRTIAYEGSVILEKKPVPLSFLIQVK